MPGDDVLQAHVLRLCRHFGVYRHVAPGEEVGQRLPHVGHGVDERQHPCTEQPVFRHNRLFRLQRQRGLIPLSRPCVDEDADVCFALQTRVTVRHVLRPFHAGRPSVYVDRAAQRRFLLLAAAVEAHAEGGHEAHQLYGGPVAGGGHYALEGLYTGGIGLRIALLVARHAQHIDQGLLGQHEARAGLVPAVAVRLHGQGCRQPQVTPIGGQVYFLQDNASVGQTYHAVGIGLVIAFQGVGAEADGGLAEDTERRVAHGRVFLGRGGQREQQGREQ